MTSRINFSRTTSYWMNKSTPTITTTTTTTTTTIGNSATTTSSSHHSSTVQLSTKATPSVGDDNTSYLIYTGIALGLVIGICIIIMLIIRCRRLRKHSSKRHERLDEENTETIDLSENIDISVHPSSSTQKQQTSSCDQNNGVHVYAKVNKTRHLSGNAREDTDKETTMGESESLPKSTGTQVPVYATVQKEKKKTTDVLYENMKL
ncbi:hypothetical protein LSH36_50g00054 [Paralvinella palmiformis]|uniref:Uncharacterized protein n=1 Tax=Paralvinella palmiformis TaxID=53620 RepID=A0AAD9K6Q8_9ANNE|nr:hypothetical protein LSH36_50g00054 [Paralvinella palmiformis]